jgi:Capsule polysaccharide biosynthesis protein
MKDTFWKIERKIRRLSAHPNEWRQELEFVKRWLGLSASIDETVVRLGHNWENAPDLTVMLLWHVNIWKREFLVDYLDDYRVCFVRSRTSLRRLRREHPDLFQSKYALGVWGNRPEYELKRFAASARVDFFRIEDGFLRSMGGGILHSRPHSLVFDQGGLYYDARSKSDIQTFFDQVNLDQDPNLAAQARAGLSLMRAARLSKYYTYFKDHPVELEDDEGQERREKILVVGQVPGDASIRYGNLFKFNLLHQRFSNVKLMQAASDYFSAAKLFYKPHPDTGLAKIKTIENSAHPRTVTIIDADEPIANLVSAVDAVFTQTSLVGLEAALRGTRTVVRGVPFYSGRGLTQDMRRTPRRQRKLTAEEMFAAAYILYPRYVHPQSSRRCTFFDVASEFIIEQVKHLDVRQIPAHWLSLDAMRGVDGFLPAPLRLLLHLNQCSDVATANTEFVLSLIDGQPRLQDFPQFSELLIGSFNYDALHAYTNLVLERLTALWADTRQDMRLVANFFAALCHVHQNLNGRISLPLVGLSSDMAELYIGNPSYSQALLSYVRALSNNLQYDELETLLLLLVDNEDVSHSFFQQLCTIIRSNPTRSERDHARRRALLLVTADAYRLRLTVRFPKRHDLFLNAVMTGMALDDEVAVVESFELLVASFEKGQFSFSNPQFESWGNLSRRIGHFIQLFNFLMRKGRFSLARTLLEKHFYTDDARMEESQKTEMENSWIALHAAEADHVGVINRYSTAGHGTLADDSTIMRYARSLRALGEFQQAGKLLGQRLLRLNIPSKKIALQQEIDKINFCIESSRILRSYPQPKIPTGVVFLASQTCYNTLAMMTPALYCLKKKGYAIVNLMEGMAVYDPCGIDYIDKFSGSIPSTLYRHDLSNSWEVNWKERIVAASGINYYQGFYERLSTRVRKYEVDINEDAAQRDFYVQLRRSDTCLDLCQKIYNDIVLRNINVVFVTGNSHVTPFSIFRDFARAKDDARLSFINCNVAYESYFTNLGSKFASTMCVTDMTLHRDRRAPFLALPHKFEKWYADNRGNAELKKRAHEMININRNASSDDSTAHEIIRWLKKERIAGKKVVCLFGKVPVDLNVPYDGGPGHLDMKDWLNDTLRIAGKAKDLIVLVKPHPHELRPEIALDLIDGFSDLIKVDLPPNARVLGHRDINVHALAQHLDLAVLWNGSSGLELTALGVPTMMASHFGRHDYPVELIYPKSRDQYESYMRAGKFRTPSAELRNRSAFLISYMGTPDISVLNEYSLRQITNDKVGVPRWRWDHVNDFLKTGDARMDLIADRIIEKFTGVSK